MQIDLFKNRDIFKDGPRLLKQIESRKYSLCVSEDELQEVLKSDKGFLTNISNKLKEGRIYKNYYSCSTDNLFEVEALGVGLYTKKYTIIMDFSDKLDYVLHRLTGCPTELIRALPNYQHISKCILTLNYDGLRSLRIGDFMDISPEICNWFAQILESITSGGDMQDDEVLEAFVSLLYQNIINEVNRLKTYVCMFLKDKYYSDFTIRSKSLSSIIATTDIKIDTKISLIDSQHNFEECELQLYSLEKYEYFTGGYCNVLNWLH